MDPQKPTNKKKSFSLAFIQMAWPIEVGALILFTMYICIFGTPEAAQTWLSAIPALSILIGAQGGAASVGPAVADRTKAIAQRTNPEGSEK